MNGIRTMVKTAGGIYRLPQQYPVIRGMVSYAIIWPCSSLVQEYIEYGNSLREANWARATRFGVFGSFCMAPVFYTWLKYTQPFFKKKTLGVAVKRALIEQVSYSPVALTYFLFGMSMLENKPLQKCVDEVKQKFWPTYKIGVIYWPIVQTINFRFIHEKHRMTFVCVASFVWTVYLAHVKSNSPITATKDDDFQETKETDKK